MSLACRRWIYSDLAWARVAALLPVVKRCAAEGDAVALRIVSQSVDELALGIRAVALQLGVTSAAETQAPGPGETETAAHTSRGATHLGRKE